MRTHTVVLQHRRAVGARHENTHSGPTTSTDTIFDNNAMFENDLYLTLMITILENYNCILEKDNAILTIIFFFTTG